MQQNLEGAYCTQGFEDGLFRIYPIIPSGSEPDPILEEWWWWWYDATVVLVGRFLFSMLQNIIAKAWNGMGWGLIMMVCIYIYMFCLERYTDLVFLDFIIIIIISLTVG